MDDIQTYQIEVRGQPGLNDINANSPFKMTVLGLDAKATRFGARTDQSGLIGLLRHLHARGLVLISVCCRGK